MATDTTNKPFKKRIQTNRTLLKYIVFSFLTFGIYRIYIYTKISCEINKIASKYDKKSTMNYLLINFIFAWFTFGLAHIVWHHNLSTRIGDELRRRNAADDFGVADYWCWGILGILVIIGPWVYVHKLLNAMNYLADEHNCENYIN